MNNTNLIIIIAIFIFLIVLIYFNIKQSPLREIPSESFFITKEHQNINPLNEESTSNKGLLENIRGSFPHNEEKDLIDDISRNKIHNAINEYINQENISPKEEIPWESNTQFRPSHRFIYSSKIILNWVDHLLYTRLVTMYFFNNSPELEIFIHRLMQNQQDIGKTLSSYFQNAEIERTITDQLTEHINIAVKVLNSIKSGNKLNLTEALKEFYKNAQNIGIYFDSLFKTQNKFQHHMKMHIDTLVSSVNAYVKSKTTHDHIDYENDVRAMDNYVNSGINMAIDMSNLL